MKQLYKKLRNKVAMAATSLVCLIAASTASAQIDTTAAVAEVTNAGTAVGAVGGAILVLAGISLSYRWVKATFF